MRSRRSMRPRQHAIATYAPLIKGQTAEIEAGLAELDAGGLVQQVGEQIAQATGKLHYQYRLSAFGAQRIQVRDKGRFRVFVARSRRDQGLIADIQRPRRLPCELGANSPGILTPRTEVAPERMQDNRV